MSSLRLRTIAGQEERRKPEDEEGLSEESERQLAKFSDMSNAINQMAPILSNLKAQCRLLGSRQKSLETDIELRMSESVNLEEQILLLTMERDELKADTKGIWLSSAKPLSATSSGSSSSIFEGDVQGKLNRRIWLLEEQVKTMKSDKFTMKKEHDDDIERERAISSGLRDRISELEIKRKKLKDDKDGLQMQHDVLKFQVEDFDMERRQFQQIKDRDLADLNDSLRVERREKEQLREEVQKLKMERDQAIAEANTMRPNANGAGKVQSPPRILQPHDLNVSLSQQSTQPTTPTKPKQLRSFTPLVQSPSSRVHQPITSTTIARQYAILQISHDHLSQTHKALKEEYDKIRKLYAEDIEHMKKYQASQIERKQKKDEKRARKKAASVREGTAAQSTTGSSGHTLQEQEDDSCRTDIVLIEESESLPRVTIGDKVESAEQMAIGDEEEYLAYAQQEESHKSERQRDENINTSWREQIQAKRHSQQPTSLLAPVQRHVQQQDELESSLERSSKALSIQRPLSRAHPSISISQSISPVHKQSRCRRSSMSTPGLPLTAFKRIVQPAHVTPWLGADTSTPSTADKQNRTSRNRKQEKYDSDDDFASPPEVMDQTPTIGRVPLVRDRLGQTPALGGTSIRKKTIQQRFEELTSEAHRSRAESIPGPSGIATHISEEPAITPHRFRTDVNEDALTTTRKRKIVDIETEGLTPSEKAMKLKRIAKMPVSAKRELYAGFKGKGRYVRPDDVDQSIRDEYEINPSENDGNKFAFHDVRRKRSERKNMHGGDCECCKSYYDSVGEIPRFNQAPKWRDERIEKDQENDAQGIQDHQNLVSRHRETWVRAPTPPGFWKIGFPSTQDVEEQNKQADHMNKAKEDRIKKEAL
ncbi:uncharacterized protein I206_106019 [Kwoniella pini CBS 10737]|uniref:DNA endonuclease activator Ctp1 C-terminal domain-containing protein n=1 Tax=Kwoniella pini CBS 10737 TaxID=1296096 RepID=A0A1B9I0W1_9TREE|nr:uncharacterized protein I206_04842 [Kwoniella pini CBS 10737]OCF49154.1 hypothetical protein I206_04842 [Kwoniella pini CBS 10737]